MEEEENISEKKTDIFNGCFYGYAFPTVGRVWWGQKC